MNSTPTLRAKFTWVRRLFTERQQRLLAALEAISFGRGGISVVARNTGLSRTTIHRGMNELQRLEKSANPLSVCQVQKQEMAGAGHPGMAQPSAATDLANNPLRSRNSGGGRKKAIAIDPELPAALERLIDLEMGVSLPAPLRWTCQSTRELARGLANLGHAASHVLVDHLLHELGYELHNKNKPNGGENQAERASQFRQVNERISTFLAQDQPAVIVEAKLEPDTAGLVVENIRFWWRTMGQQVCAQPRQLLICAGFDGSNDCATKLWQAKLDEFARESGLTIQTVYLPPGTTKWQKLGCQFSCQLTQKRPGTPLIGLNVSVRLIVKTLPGKC